MKSNFIWINGDFIHHEEAGVDILAPTRPNRGMVFEDIRCYETAAGPAVFRLEDHLEAFLDAIRAMGYNVSYSLETLCDTVHRTLTYNGVREGNIRPAIYVSKGDTVDANSSGDGDAPVLAVAAWEWPHFAGQEADGWGFEDAVILNAGDLEKFALFMVRENTITTSPSAQFGNRIKRDSVITLARDLGYVVVEQPISRSQLYQANEVFVSTTIADIKPVREFDSHPINNGRVGPITRKLQTAFFETARGRGRRSVEWLDWVWSSFVGL
ncbi:MAG: aminotransferase class IV [Anaerolineales bacterium]